MNRIIEQEGAERAENRSLTVFLLCWNAGAMLECGYQRECGCHAPECWNKNPASGVASAHRYNLASSITIFKTRLKPCRIAVRADIKKSRPSTEKRPRFAAICTSLITELNRILSLGVATLRFSADCRLPTAV